MAVMISTDAIKNPTTTSIQNITFLKAAPHQKQQAKERDLKRQNGERRMNRRGMQS
jgi:hypothetical protein